MRTLEQPVTERTADGTAYDVFGPPEAPVVILIHGLGLCRDLWQSHVPDLSRSYRVIAYDLYGHGDSLPAPEPATLKLFSDQILSLMDALNVEKAWLIGFSIGGMINRRFALDHNERLAGLVIMNSPHDRGAEAQKMVEARVAKVREEGRMATMESALERWFTSSFRSENPETLKGVRQWRERVDPESYAQSAWVLANGVRELIAPTPAVEAPALVMTAENDSGSTPAMSHAIAAEINGSDCLIVPDLQHLALLEDPDAFTNPILDFLKRCTT